MCADSSNDTNRDGTGNVLHIMRHLTQMNHKYRILSIFSSIDEQIEAIKFFKYVNQIREHLKDHILPGGPLQV